VITNAAWKYGSPNFVLADKDLSPTPFADSLHCFSDRNPEVGEFRLHRWRYAK
jgi:hypothetical protein